MDNKGRSPYRRNVLKTIGSITAVGAGTLSTASVGTADDDPPFEVRDLDWWDQQSARRTIGVLNRNSYIRELQDTLRERGLQPKHRGITAATLVTDDEAVNETNPALVNVPFTNPANGNGRSGSDGGLLNVLLVDGEDGVRLVASALGTVVDDRSGSVQTADQGGHVTHFGNVGEERLTPGVIGTGTVDLGPQTSDISCDVCQIIANALCDYAGSSVTTSACFEVGVACLSGGSIPGAVGCLGACYAIVGAISLTGCYYASSEICEEAGFC